nr:MAG TPA: replicative helicase [Bacteriophage sp.]
MSRSNIELYLDKEQQNRAFASTEELLAQIRRILIYWLDQCSGESDAGQDMEKLFGYWESRCAETAKRGWELPYISMRETLSLNRFEEFLIWIALIRQLDAEFAAELRKEGFSEEELTLEDVFLLFQRLTGDNTETEYALLNPDDRLNVVLFQEWEEERTERLVQRPVRLKKTALDFLLGQDYGIHELSGIAVCLTPDEEPLLQNEALYGQCRDYLERIRGGMGRGVLQLSGAEGTGKRFLLKKLGEQAEFVAVSLGFLLERKCVRRDLREIISYCVLRKKYMGLRQLPAGLEPETLGYFLRLLTEYIPVVCVMTETPLRISYPARACPMEAELPGATREQQMHFWEYFAGKYQCRTIVGHGSELANLYRLTAGEIERMVRMLRARFVGEDTTYDEAREVIVSELMEDAGRKLKGLAAPLVTGFTMEDLQLPGQQTKILQFAISAIRNRYLVMEGMGFGKKMPYGRGISILLYGPPGTGKTMTAQVIAKEVGLTLFRVDSSKIMDKYIGETEKKLGELFETAKNTNAILFFDEADSLFAKRTEVSKSTDKYANNEVSFLLQLMEQYEGIMVLATNHSNFFDEAFRRRITYSINLPAPDAETRSRLWRLAFPEGVEIAADVDFDHLAREHEFTGSSIKYVAQQAMFTAAILQSPVTMECIYTGLKLMMERDCQGYKDGSLQACFTRLV